MDTIAILGAGNVGRALASRLVSAGAKVRFGVREPKAARAQGGPGVPLLAPQAAAADAGMIFLAVPAAAAVEAARSAGNLHGKVLIDCTNPVRWDSGPVWAPPPQGSVSQGLAAALPGVAVVKGFNHFGAEIQANPGYDSGPADALFAGDDAGAKRRVMEMAARMGFRPHDAGPLRNAALLENLAVLWIHLATSGGKGRQLAFRLEQRP